MGAYLCRCPPAQDLDPKSLRGWGGRGSGRDTCRTGVHAGSRGRVSAYVVQWRRRCRVCHVTQRLTGHGCVRAPLPPYLVRLATSTLPDGNLNRPAPHPHPTKEPLGKCGAQCSAAGPRAPCAGMDRPPRQSAKRTHGHAHSGRPTERVRCGSRATHGSEVGAKAAGLAKPLHPATNSCCIIDYNGHAWGLAA